MLKSSFELLMLGFALFHGEFLTKYTDHYVCFVCGHFTKKVCSTKCTGRVLYFAAFHGECPTKYTNYVSCSASFYGECLTKYTDNVFRFASVRVEVSTKYADHAFRVASVYGEYSTKRTNHVFRFDSESGGSFTKITRHGVRMRFRRYFRIHRRVRCYVHLGLAGMIFFFFFIERFPIAMMGAG